MYPSNEVECNGMKNSQPIILRMGNRHYHYQPRHQAIVGRTHDNRWMTPTDFLPTDGLKLIQTKS